MYCAMTTLTTRDYHQMFAEILQGEFRLCSPIDMPFAMHVWSADEYEALLGERICTVTRASREILGGGGGGGPPSHG